MAFLLRLLGFTEEPEPTQLARERLTDRPEAFIVVAEAFYRPHGGRERIVITFDNDAATIERRRTRKSSWDARRRLGASEAAELRAGIEAWQPWTWEPPQPVGKDGLECTFVFARKGVVHEVRCQGAAPAVVGTRLEQLTRLIPHVT
ncbi:MAG: hypothetical protein ABTQ32_19615 [Myxococcaceae bacterium]